MSSPAPAPFVNTRPKEDVHSFPRPPALERTPLRLQVIWTDAKGEETVVADSTEAYRVLETTHPPTYYIPPKDVKLDLLSKTQRSSFCEVRLAVYSSPTLADIIQSSISISSDLALDQWKGQAAYFNFNAPSSSTKVPNRIWSYPSPTKGTKFAPIANYLSFYASANLGKDAKEGWRCYVGGEGAQRGEEVIPQEGDFYGGWKTSEIVGAMKGGPGTWGW